MELCLGCQVWDLTTLPTRDAPVNDTLQEPTPEPLFNPMSPEVIADPYPYYRRLRETDPVHRSPLGFFVASRHADVAHVLRDKRFGKDFVGRMIRRFGKEVMEEPIYRSMSHWMLQQDPPDHTRLRGLVVKAFTARRVEDMRPRIQEIVDASLDRVAAQGHMDLIADFAFRLPVTVICEMLGIPKEEHELFFHGARTGGRLLDPVPLSRTEIDEANAGSLMQAEYFRSLFELRRRQPGDDLTSQLVQAEEEGAKLSNEELTANIILLFGAGHETTVNLIGNGLLALLPQSRSAAAAAARSLPDRQRHRGALALRFLRAAHEPHHAGGCRGRRRGGGQGRIGAVPARRRKPRSRPPIPIPTASTSRAPTSAPCRSAAAFTSASAPSSRASRAKSPSPPCCAACRR